ncbi:helix-turn-helix domain-containing protein [Herbiconiux flava]|uniref:DNA-binding CsgD family transcriptional regulator/tetratricopeptide (TPR) repeat protein n=1 Tax=Herbiconiux flava TaxID=881268 RepID=A0A852SRU3_9MICO|nr:helix-turn-helix transcriptional regulator [Herbiconiux flava]NYD71434.1 DNA-binding CsgD family transcriptional regulator/tetratricopeptide (TPR) repeat protein [Herbiconiux flava]
MTGRGVIVSGERGSGRSTFVRSVVAGVDEPLRRRLWVHDDDSPLDGQSGKRLAEAVVRGDVVPVLVTAVRSSAEPWLDRLTDEFEPLRLRLDPFDRAAVLRIARRLLGGPLAAEAVPILLPRRDGGDLVVLREAVRELKATGALVDNDGIWLLSGSSPRLEGLRRLLFARLDLPFPTADVETALDLVALAPELGLERTRDVLGAQLGSEAQSVLELLESTGAIDVLGLDDAVRCRVHDPVAEQLLPHTIGRLRRRRLSNAIVEALSDRPAAESDERELLALARLALPLDWNVDGAALTRAAETALRASRVDLASRLAAAALKNGAPIEASFVLAAAESQLGHPADALARLREIDVDEAVHPGRARIYEQLVQLVEARVADPDSSWSLPTGPSRSGVGSDSELASLSIEQGGTDAVISSVVPVDHSLVLEGERVAFEASLLVMRGHSRNAVDELRDVEATLCAAGADTFRVRWGQIYSMLWDQSFDTTLEQLSLLGDEAASLGRAEQESLCRWSAAVALGHAGRVAEAVPELRTALHGLERFELGEAALLAQLALAQALAAAGEGAEANGTLAPILAASAGKPLLEGWARDAHGWVLHGLGEHREAVDEFLAAASIHGGMGFSLSEIIALSGAARSGAAARVVGRMEELATTVDGCSIVLLVRQARALARKQAPDGADPDLADEFDGIGETAASLGMHAHAQEAFSAAAELHVAEGRTRPAAASSRRAAAHAAICRAGAPGDAGPSGPQLSDREREIVDLVLQGRSNREIAETLVLSVRTVETHLLRVYRKLGVRGRSELAGALSGSGVGIPGASKALQDSELNS